MTDRTYQSEVDNLISASQNVRRGNFQCTICNIFFCKKNRGVHMRLIHNRYFRCKFHKCVSYFATKAERGRHYKVQGNSGHKIKTEKIKRIKLDAIKSEFANAGAEKEKLLTAEEERARVKCVHCGKMYKHKESLRVHNRVYHSEISIRCKFIGCNLQFLSQEYHDEHFRLEHQDNVKLEKVFHCPKCSYDAVTKDDWLFHFKANHIKYPF